MTQYLSDVRVRLSAAALALAVFSTMLVADYAAAAADPVTGIDPKADIADPALASAKPWILAGVAIVVVLAAIGLGAKLLKRVSGVGR
jgi:hypothetical protein